MTATHTIEISGSQKKPTSPKNEFTPNPFWNRHVLKKENRRGLGLTLKGQVYNFLERPSGWKCLLYHFAVFVAVVITLVFSILSTIAEYENFGNSALYWMEFLLVLFFGVEYILRVWSAGCRVKYMGSLGRLRFMRKPICIIDFLVVIASGCVISMGSTGQVFASSAIRGVRFLQILRMLRVDRQGGTWRLLGTVIYIHRRELITTMYIGFLGLIFSSYFVYLAEKDVHGPNGQGDFSSYADALWWGVATYTTIGYGDKVPRTWIGRAITCFFSLVIISFITLPSGILGSGFALKVQQKQRQKHFSRQFPAAAIFIQCAWRVHAAEKCHTSVATWKIYLQELPFDNLNKKNFVRPIALLLRKPRNKSEVSTPDVGKKSKNDRKINSGYENYAMEDVFINVGENNGNDKSNDVKNENSSDILGAESTDDLDYENDILPRVTTLTEVHRNAIRAIRKMKYFVARRNFLATRKPYDVQDVMEQYSQGHVNMMFRIKEVQRRLDRTLGRPSQYRTVESKSVRHVTLVTRVTRMEQKLNNFDKKLDIILDILINNKRNDGQVQDDNSYL